MLDSLTKLIGGTKLIAVNIAGLLMAIAFIVFLLTIINYVWKRNQGNVEGLKQAGNMLFAAVFALFVMVAVWGITEFIARNLGVGVGGCTSRPSPVPGEPAITECSGGATSNTGSASPIGNGPKTSCPNGQTLVGGYCEGSTGARPANTAPPVGTTNSGATVFRCENGTRQAAASGEVLSCSNGINGEPCKSGTCGAGYSCDLNGTDYGTCKSI